MEDFPCLSAEERRVVVGNVKEVDRFCQGSWIPLQSGRVCQGKTLDPQYLLKKLCLSGDGEDISRIEFGE